MDAIADNIVIPGLTFLSIVAIGASVLISKEQRRKAIESRVQESDRIEPTAQDLEKKKSGLLRFLEKVGNLASHGRASTSLWEELVRAGYLSRAAPAIYTGIKILLFVIGCMVAAILALPMDLQIMTEVIMVFLAGASLFFVPNIMIVVRLKKRHDEIWHHLPEAIDLLEICVSSGIGLGMAWNIVAEEIQNVSPTLSSAMALTNFEIHLGVSRIEAMRHMARRTSVDEVSSLAATLVQTERFGTSISTALREFAASMRDERFFAAEERAEKMAVKLIIPMVLFVFPAVLITVAGPAVVAIFRMMASS